MTAIGNPALVAANADMDSVEGAITRGARKLVTLSTEDGPLIGYITIGVYGDGGYSLGWRTPDNHIIGRTMFTALVKEVIARELTGAMSAEDYAKEYLT